MFRRIALLTLASWSVGIATALAQQCLHSTDEPPDQAARRREALTAARSIDTLQANRPEAGQRSYLLYDELESAPYAAVMRKSTNPLQRRISLKPNDEILPGWSLTLDRFEHGYWFMVKDTADPCGFAYISNQDGLIFNAEVIR